MEIKSEFDAKDRLLNELNKPSRSTSPWFLLGNLFFTDKANRTNNEIDFLLIGPSGVQLIEVKGWTKSILDEDLETVMDQCGILSQKAKRFASLADSKGINCGYIHSSMLFTKSPKMNSKIDGIPIFGYKEIGNLIDSMRTTKMDSDACLRLVSLFKPQTLALKKGRFNKIGATELEPYDISRGYSLHRIFKGHNPTQGVDVDVHLFDFSAADSEHEKKIAMREAESLVSLCKQPGVPRLIDGFQNAPQYPREIYFYSVERVQGKPLLEKIIDSEWTSRERITFCINALTYLEKLHQCSGGNFIHRNISPSTLFVDTLGLPCYTEFDKSRHGIAQTISTYTTPPVVGDWIPPEITQNGLISATQQSDIYSLCYCLIKALEGGEDKCSFIAEILKDGTKSRVDERFSIASLLKNIRGFLKDEDRSEHFRSLSAIAVDDILPLNNRSYQVVQRLGSGGYSTAYRVVDKDNPTASYCAKIYHAPDLAKEMTDHYAKVRPISANNGIQTIFDISTDLSRDKIHLLCKFIDGRPLSSLLGSFMEYCDDTIGEFAVTVLERWGIELLEKISPLHQAELVHGDISPSNILISDGSLWIIDLDLILEAGETYKSEGTPAYSVQVNGRKGKKASPADDVIACARILESLIRTSVPKTQVSSDDKVNHSAPSMNAEYRGWLIDFLGKALSDEEEQQFKSSQEALEWISFQASSKPSGYEADSISRLCGKLSEELISEMNIEDRIREVISGVEHYCETNSIQINSDAILEEVCSTLAWLCESTIRKDLASKAVHLLHDLANEYSELVLRHLDSRFGLEEDNDDGDATDADSGETSLSSPTLYSHDLRNGRMWLKLSRWAKVNGMFSGKARGFLYDYGNCLSRNWGTSARQDDWAKSLLDKAIAKGFEA